MIYLSKKVLRFGSRNLALRRLLRNWREVAVSLHSGVPVRRLELRGGAVLIAPDAAHLDFLFNEIWIDQVYSPRGYEIRNGDVVIDIGANIGVFSAFAALHARDVEVFAYEPSPENASLLRTNVAVIDQSRVRVFEQAVAGWTGRRILEANPSNWIVHTLAEPGSTATGLPVTCVSLDDLMEQNAIKHCDLLKMDCEGSEYEILRSTRPETLRCIDKIVGEYHRPPGKLSAQSPEDLLDALLRSRGFFVEGMHSFEGGGGGIFHARRSDRPRP
jgi:FkbM family methyltransferase